MKDQSQPSASGNILKKASKLLKISLITLAIGSFVSIVLFILAYQELKKHELILQEIETIKRSNQNTNELRQYVTSQKEIIDLISQVFPNEITIIDIIQEIEAVVKSIDNNGTVSISALTPSKVNNELSVPLVLTLHISPAESVALLRQLERTPHIIQVSSYEIKGANQSKGELVIGARLYVQDPFTQQ